ncbi:hypothetical protein V7138_10890 [Bacillus sp. JJ1533]|uniref:hypothetical protein n=1 Tax=Bacillus sp. JJ1533 TaxID=3122959 RepID=UPI002FFE5364
MGKVIASEQTAPANMHSVVQKVTNAKQLTEAWDYFSMKKKPPKGDFNTYEYYIVSMHESSGCPFKLKNITVDDDKQELNFYFKHKGGSCTADALPRTFVIKVDKDATIGLENVSIIILES